MKVDPEVYKKIIEDRKKGATYSDIITKYGVGKWWCINHLREIKPLVEKDTQWKQIEDEAQKVLEDMDFKHILNLNLVANCPYWDYYAEKNQEKWLFDVTINGQKNLIEKGLRLVEGFKSAVLIKRNEKWKLLEIKISEIKNKIG